MRAEFTPTDIVNYSIVKDTVLINVLKAKSVITWTNPADISYGTALSNTQLNATASFNGNPVDGVFTYSPAKDSVLNAGDNQELRAEFTPTDIVNYSIVKDTVLINVLKAKSVITWANPADIVYGTALGDSHLNASASYNGNLVDGVFTYSPAKDSVLNAGDNQELKVEFIPTDLVNYNITKDTVHINVLKLTPEITWGIPENMVYGTLLDDTQLNAGQAVAGIYTYTPDFGTELNPGQHTLSVTFTPTDALNYNMASKSINILVYENFSITPYCDASAQIANTIYQYISQVNLGTISNNSLSSNYQNNTSQITNLEINTQDTIKISVENYTEGDQVAVWIDWNNDHDFDDDKELINTTIDDSAKNFIASFSVPEFAVLGRSRMRIRLQNTHYDPNLYPCGYSLLGEVEDYSVNIIAPTTPMHYLSTKIIADSVIYKGMTNQPILCINVQMNGTVDPQTINSLHFTSTGNLNHNDISNAKLFYTGGNNEFSDTLQFGVTYNAPMGVFEINGSQTLSGINNYFWLTYNIASSAQINDTLLVCATEITIAEDNHNFTYEYDSILVKDFSFEITQNTNPVFAGKSEQDIIGVILNNKSIFSRKLQSVVFNIEGTSDFNELSNLKLYCTGSQNHYAPQTQFGETQPVASNSCAFFGDHIIKSGKNYLWFVNDISKSAVNNNFVDAGLMSVSINNVVFVPEKASPDSARIVSSFNGNTYSNFMSASMVIGQPDFYTQDLTIDQDGGFKAFAVAISSKGMLAMISQSTSSDGKTAGRVLLWNSIPETDGTPADIVIGQPNFTSSVLKSCSRYGIKSLQSAAFSPDGEKLLLADTENNRVLIYQAPFTNGMAANVVIGQTDFDSGLSGCSDSQLSNPYSVFVNTDGKLFIADFFNGRVLIYNSIPIVNGASADVVVGQVDFNSHVWTCTSTSLGGPTMVAVSPDKKLLISDADHKRVLVYNTIPESNGAAADVVIGHADFTSSSNMSISDSTLLYPNGISVSHEGKLAIGDYTASRVLIYNSIPEENGAKADIVLGQPDFDSQVSFNGGISDRSMNTPHNVAYDLNGRLFVAGRDMHRIMVYGDAPALKADLQVDLSIDDANFEADSTITYVLKLNNNGSNAASDVEVDFQVPYQFTMLSAQGGGTYTNYKWLISSILSNTEKELRLIAKLKPNNEGETIRATANILYSDKLDPNMENNSCFADFVTNIIWTGNVSNNWNDSLNWNIEKVPAAHQSAIITSTPSGAFFPEVFDEENNINNLSIEKGAYINLPDTCILGVFGNFKSLSDSATGTGHIGFAGSSPQTLEGKVSSLVIVNGKHVSLSGNTFVRDAVVLLNGKLKLGDYNLHMGDSAKFISKFIKEKEVAKAEITKLRKLFRSYVVTNGTGNLIQKVDTVAKEFPIGTETNYRPALISNKGTADHYSLRVFPDVLEHGTSGNQISDINHFVKASWNIEEEVSGGSDLSLELFWQPTAKPSMRLSKFGIGMNTGESWDKPSLEIVEFSKLGFMISRDSITTVGTFAIGDSCSRLALEASPVLIADNTDNNPLHAITFTFADDQVWADSIQSISIDGGIDIKAVSSILADSITIPVGNFPEGNRNYYIEIISKGYTTTSLVQHIAKVDQEIQFNPITNLVVNIPLTLDAQVTSSLALEYISTNTNIIDVKGGIALPLKTGKAIIMVSQKGNDVYNAAVSVQHEFTSYALGQAITFSAIVPKTYGQVPFTPAVAGGASNNPIIFTSSDSSIAICNGAKGETITIVGAGSCKIYANQAGDATYAPALQQEQELIVNKATPVLTWNNPADITYGTLLSETQLNATPDIDGEIVYTPATGTKLNAGNNQELKADFTPTDAVNYNIASKTVNINVDKATPVLIWNNPADITYGTLLSETQLNATPDIDGEIVYTPATGTKLNAGNNQELKADFTPTDAVNYNIASKTVNINVDKATPVLIWNNPADITYGTLLSETQLNATADIDGEFIYTPATGTKLNAGNNQELKADFTPTDAVNYNIASKTVNINIDKVTPVLTWNNPADITYGTLLSETLLNATADIDGEIVYTPASGTKLDAGNNQALKADFTPTDAVNYNIDSKTVNINVDKATPVLTWNNPADIIYGTLLSETQLNASADIDGTFIYNPVAGTRLEVGDAQELKLDFAPSDAVNYNTAFKAVLINILKSTGIDDLNVFELSVYPNPATNQISIKDLSEINSSNDLHIEIIDVNGKTHLIKEAHKDDLNPIDIQALPLGMYILKIVTDNKVKLVKFIKQ